MKGRRRQLLIGVILAAGLLFLAFRGVDTDALVQALRAAHALPLVGLVALTVVAYGIRAWRWGYLLAPLGRVPVPRLFVVTMIGFTSGFVVPRAGEVLRPYLVDRSHGIPTSAGFATIILERLLDMATVLVLFGLYLLVLPEGSRSAEGPLMQALRVVGGVRALGAVAALVLVVFVILFLFHTHAERMMNFLSRWFDRLPARLAGPLSKGLRAFGVGLAVFKAPLPHLLAILGQSLLLWLVIAVTFQLNHWAFGIELPFIATFLLIAFLVVGVAIPTPGMIGGFHAFYILALNGVYGVDKGVVAAAALTAHGLSNLPVLLIGLLAMAREGLGFGRVADMTDQEAEAAGSQP